jgi:tetratricopeptide (TPR) repeat protein
MYNFKFDNAEMQFRWLLQKYPDHPLPYFLLGLSQWWKMMPDISNESWDEPFEYYMDLAIEKADSLHEFEENKIEAAFFLAACYGQKGRLYSERGSWLKAANAGRLALKYHEESHGMNDLSPEFLFGDALYNYYSVWIRENYPILKPIMIPFPKGDKELGIEQLRTVAGNAFYTRIEAQLFLMRILALDENDPRGALLISEYLHSHYPDNPYFHRFYARLLYSNGLREKMEVECKEILQRIDDGKLGYEANSGRYAGFFLGQYYESTRRIEEAKYYYGRTVKFAEQIEAFETGYYHYSLFSLARIADSEDEHELADTYLDLIKKYTKRKDNVNKQVREYQKQRKKERKSKKQYVNSAQIIKHDRPFEIGRYG